MTNIPYITIIVLLVSILNYLRINSYTKTIGYDEALIKCGALVSTSKELWRVFTASFVHMSLQHLLMNIYCLASLGVMLENFLGHVYYTILLFGSMILGNVFSYYFSKDTYTISGGLSSGLYGLMLFELKLIYSYYGIASILSDTSLLITIVINLTMNFMPGIGWKAHLGGAIFGVLFATLLLI